jgi:hypothetical protein
VFQALNVTKKPEMASGDEESRHLTVEVTLQLQIELMRTDDDARHTQ